MIKKYLFSALLAVTVLNLGNITHAALFYCVPNAGCQEYNGSNSNGNGFFDLASCISKCPDDSRNNPTPTLPPYLRGFKPAQNFTNISSVVSLAMGLITIGAGILTLYYFFYGAYKYLTAAGVAEEVAKAQKTITWSAIGLIFILLAYTVTNIILTASGFGKL